MRASLVSWGAAALLLSGCGGPGSGTSGGASDAAPAPSATFAALRPLQDGRCLRCHAHDAQLPGTPARRLDRLGRRVDLARGVPALAEHFAGDDAADVRAWLASLQADAEPVANGAISAGVFERGAALADELACRACHDDAALDRAADGQLGSLRAWLAAPHVAHVPLSDDEAHAVAVWLLRGQRKDGVRVPGFAWRCFETRIANGDWPDLAGLEPAARGASQRITTEVGTRKANYALEFTATLDVPTAGEWTFATRSDDGSWLWLDGELVVDNPGLKPAARREGRVQLTAGAHALRVGYTQAAGGAVLEVTWAGPDRDEEELPGASAHATAVSLVPPAVVANAPDADAVARGRAAARSARCDACHAFDDPAFDALPAPAAAKAWSELGDGACPSPAAADVRAGLRADPDALARAAADDAARLLLSMQADGCLSCHVRDGVGGLAAAARGRLVEVEDLGEEGLVPPDLSDVGRRLRPAWLERVVREGHAVRDYVHVRMPAYGDEVAARYAERFARVDAADVVDEEPAFAADAVNLGRDLVGTGGRNCISCHRVAGRDSLGPQGMDLAIQHARLRPAWFRDWLLRPQTLRPGTRMPSLWITHDERDVVEVDAVRVWSSLGEAAPLPKGVVVDARSLVLEPIERPILHGAFLKDVSARTLSVGTPERTHYAFDLVEPRLVWLWRGAFLDARGTWHGRAGKLVEPLGKDWQVVDDFAVVGADGEAVARRLSGQRRTPDGYPVLRVAAGDARYEDEARPRLAAGGSELVRTVRCVGGAMTLSFPDADGYEATVAGAPAGRHTLNEGETLEVVYRW